MTIKKPKVELVSYWRVLYKTWSLRLGAIATLFLSFGALFPTNAYDIYCMLPYEARQLIPEQAATLLGIALYILSMLSQFIRQKKLVQKLKEGENTNA